MTDNWYSNKEIFEMLQGLKEELRETRILVKQYNGLRKDLAETMSKVAAIEQQNLGKTQVGTSIREWTGWVIAILALVVSILRVII